MTHPSRAFRFIPWLVLALALLSLSCFVFPMYVIRPFRHQGADELRLALFVKQIGPSVSASCAVLAFGLLLFGWRWMRGSLVRGGAVFSLLLALAGSYLARLNVYELMFHPAGIPQFQAVEQTHLDKDDMVLAVRVNNVARAYPIREMAYHHIVNDTLAGEPIVATY